MFHASPYNFRIFSFTLFKFFSKSTGIFSWVFLCCSVLSYLFNSGFTESDVARISFPLPSLDSVVFVFEPNSLSSFLSSLWTSSREMEKKFLTLSSLVLHVRYFRIRVVLHSCKLAQAVIVWRGFIGSLVGHRSWEFWILVWALLDRISYSFIIWPNLCTFSQEYWKVHMIQRPFPVKYKNWI